MALTARNAGTLLIPQASVSGTNQRFQVPVRRQYPVVPIGYSPSGQVTVVSLITETSIILCSMQVNSYKMTFKTLAEPVLNSGCTSQKRIFLSSLNVQGLYASCQSVVNFRLRPTSILALGVVVPQ